MGFIVAGVIAVLAAALTTYTQVKAAKEREEEMEVLAEQKKREAEAAVDAAAFEERQARRRNALLLGKQRAIYAAAGLDPEIGSPLLNEIDFLKQSELEALNIRAIGAGAAASSRFERNIAKYRGRQAKASIAPTIAGGVLSAAAGATGSYNRSQLSTLSDWNTRQSGTGGP